MEAMANLILAGAILFFTVGLWMIGLVATVNWFFGWGG